MEQVFDWFEENQDYMFAVFRIIVGFAFFMHGAQKLLGWFGGSVASSFSMFWWAGVIEFVGGLLLVLGLFTRIVALVGGAEMIVAWILVHIPQGWNPLTNGGEAALLNLAAFLVLASHESDTWCLR